MRTALPSRKRRPSFCGGEARLRILLLGANGLIGSAVAARLAADGHEIVAVRRGVARAPSARSIRLDLRHATRPEDWLPLLQGIDAVVNCAGVFQDSPRDSTEAVHAGAPIALWAACERAGVRRIVQLSATGVEDGGVSPFSSSKARGDAALQASKLDWVILRPSVVVGRAAYGGSALIRGLSALPLLPVIPDSGPIDVVQLDDVAETVVRLVRPHAPARLALELAGPDRLAFADIVAAYRRWLGWPPARAVRVPRWLLGAAWRAGDLAAWFGWRPPIRTNARRELVRGAIGDSALWTKVTGIRPISLAASLSVPAPVQERWFARLYLLKPVALLVLAAFWIATGLVSLGAGWGEGVALMGSTLVAGKAEAAVVAGALADIAVGVAILFRRTARVALVAGLGVAILYLILATLLMPVLWADPLGALVKVVPIVILHLLVLAVIDER